MQAAKAAESIWAVRIDGPMAVKGVTFVREATLPGRDERRLWIPVLPVDGYDRPIPVPVRGWEEVGARGTSGEDDVVAWRIAATGQIAESTLGPRFRRTRPAPCGWVDHMVARQRRDHALELAEGPDGSLVTRGASWQGWIPATPEQIARDPGYAG